MLALFACTVLFQDQVTQPLFEAVDRLQHRVVRQISGQVKLLIGPKIVAMAAHQGEQASILGAGRIEAPPTGQEVMIDDADDMEAAATMRALGKCVRTSER